MSYFSYPKYDDVVIPSDAVGGLAALTVEQYRDTGYLKPHFRHDQDDTVFVTVQMPHRKRLGSVLGDLHLHLIPLGAPGAGVTEYAYFRTNWTWQSINGAAFPAIATWSADVFVQFPVVAADQFKMKLCDLISGVAAPSPEGYSSVLLARITRLGNTGGANDTYKTNKVGGTVAANLCLLSVDAHILCDRLGSHHEASD